jgi:predicted ATPase/class 3 adenylate cyclase
MAELPRGTVTLLFTDIEGSTRLLQELGEAAYVLALEDHRRLLRHAFSAHGGVEVEMQGDSFHFVFADPSEALVAAAKAQVALAEHAWERKPIRVRIGIHTGKPVVTGDLYAGLDVHRAARVMSAGHGGQVLVSETTEALVEAALPDRLLLRDLGLHRLKDLSAPQRLFQLGQDEFPPLRSLYQTNLPVPSTPFLGRERELQEVSVLLADESNRLLTLTGAGGSGKTRLAAQAAADVSELYPDGVFWVGLTSLREPALVSSTIAHVVGANEDLAELIDAKRILLLLDNFEHLLPAAIDLAELLGACPNLKLLVTSREPLHLSNEREYVVLPLRDADAVSLFHERVRASGIELAPNGDVAAICRQLDHLPLAIELAAARTKVLSPRALLERLERRLPLLTGGARDMPERQRTLRATISWSYELLGAEERRLFARLAVFVGGCTLEAAEEVCEAELDTLQSLVEKSLLRRREGRFWMLETIREYGLDLLEQTDSDAFRFRHLQFFTTLAEQAHHELKGVRRTEWIERVREDIDNARAALTWKPRSPAAGELQLRLAAALRLYWDSVGSIGEGRRWIEEGLVRAHDPAAELRYDAYLGASAFASQQRDFEMAFDYSARAVAAAHELGDPARIATALMRTAIDCRLTADLPRALELYEEALSLAERAGDDHLRGAITHNLGDLALYEDDFERARVYFATALEAARGRGDSHETAYALCNLALASFKLGHARVFEYLGEALTIIAGLCWPFGSMYSLELAGCALAQEDPVCAARLLATAEAMRVELEVPLDPFEQAIHDDSVATALRELGAEGYLDASDAGRAMSGTEAIDDALERLRTVSLSTETL